MFWIDQLELLHRYVNHYDLIQSIQATLDA
jgi:hypothetical protein